MEYQYSYNSFGRNCPNPSCYGLLYTKEIVFLLTFIIYGVLILVMRIERVDVSDHPGWTEVEKGSFRGRKCWIAQHPILQNLQNNQGQDGTLLNG